MPGPVHVAPWVQQRLSAASHALASKHWIVVLAAVDSMEVPHVCTPSQPKLQLETSPRHLTSLHDCRPGHEMLHVLARHTIGVVEHE